MHSSTKRECCADCLCSFNKAGLWATPSARLQFFWAITLSAFLLPFPSYPCECSTKVQLIQSMLDDSRHSVPSDTHTHTHMHHGVWRDEVCEIRDASASQHTCGMISCSPSSLATQTLHVSADATSCFCSNVDMYLSFTISLPVS